MINIVENIIYLTQSELITITILPLTIAFTFLPLPLFIKHLSSVLPIQSALALREIRGNSFNFCFHLLWGFGSTILLCLVAHPDL